MMKSVDWIVIHIAHRPEDADRLKARLEAEGFLIRVVARAQMGVWELQSTRLESVEARDFLLDNLHEQE